MSPVASNIMPITSTPMPITSNTIPITSNTMPITSLTLENHVRHRHTPCDPHSTREARLGYMPACLVRLVLD
eukprot:2461952-Pyramimonas_sp.AAC.1